MFRIPLADFMVGRLPEMYCDVLTVNTAMSCRTWVVLSQVREDGIFVVDFAEHGICMRLSIVNKIQ